MSRFSRRDWLKGVGAVSFPALLPGQGEARVRPGGSVVGLMSGARALVETLLSEGCGCVFGIPGAQENELWDAMKSRGLPYLLVTHENSAAAMADGFARATGKPGVLSVVPGPGLTNSLTGIGEALLDSIPLVCVVGDVARGEKYRPFQVHDLNMEGLLKQVCKEVLSVGTVGEIPRLVRQAFQKAVQGEPGPVALLVPYNLFIETHRFQDHPLTPVKPPLHEPAFKRALELLSQTGLRVGIYAGLGCMNFSSDLTSLAEVLNAPVATSVSGKGAIDECHPLAVGWGYGPQGTQTAEKAFKNVDLLLTIGARYSEVSTAFYAIPRVKCHIQVDSCEANLGKVIPATVAVHGDAGLFLSRVLEQKDKIAREKCTQPAQCIAQWKGDESRWNSRVCKTSAADPMTFLLALRKALRPDALTYVDVSLSEHWAAEVMTTRQPRTYFNPTDNQSMGWSIGAALGGQKAFPTRQVVTITGDGCFLMSAMEISTAAREALPVKFFILDDQAYHYMQKLQSQAYGRTTATMLARLDYEALSKGLGVAYQEIGATGDLQSGIKSILETPGPVLARVCVDYGSRPIRWLDAVKDRYTKELSARQKFRFMTRLGIRSLDLGPGSD
ncbi:MAG: thiamine pyrophosphate-binding protein [Gemmataceae bacterium]|nr:thiamine pyrophosphate-binding protein [Gemmataceae bacterium]